MSDDLPPGSRRSASPGNAAPTQPQNRAGASGGRDAAPPDTAGGTQNADSQACSFPDTLPSPSVPKPASWQDATLDGPPPNTEVQESPPNLIGTVIADRYEVLDKVGQGSMGAVYVARHKALGSRFAVKVMLHARDEEDSRRFLSEARLASKVNHPNTVYIADFGTLPSGRFYLVMEFLRGSTLAAVISKGPMPPARACAIAAQIAHGLSAVHKKGIIHRAC